MLQNLLTENLVTTDLAGRDKRSVIENLLTLLCNSGGVKDHDLALRDLLDHEARMSTGMENGIAIPHAKSLAVDQLIAAVGITRKKINFECLDRRPAQIFIMTLSPPGPGSAHVEFLTAIGKILNDKNKRKLLLQARNNAELLDVLLT